MYLDSNDEEKTPEVKGKGDKGDSNGPTLLPMGDPKTAQSPNTVTEVEVQ